MPCVKCTRAKCVRDTLLQIHTATTAQQQPHRNLNTLRSHAHVLNLYLTLCNDTPQHTHCSKTLQHTHCNNTPQHTHCNNTLQHTHYNNTLRHTHCNNTLQHTQYNASTFRSRAHIPNVYLTRCNNTLQHTHCNNTLQQHTATTHCNTHATTRVPLDHSLKLGRVFLVRGARARQKDRKRRRFHWTNPQNDITRNDCSTLALQNWSLSLTKPQSLNP